MGKGKLKVEILTPTGSYFKKCDIEDGHVIIKRGGLGRGDETWDPPYREDRTVPDGLFKTHKKAYYQEGADELTPLTPKEEPPKYTLRDIKKTTKADLLAKQAKTSGQTTTIETITLIGVVILAFMVWVLWLNNGVINLG